MNEQYCFVLTWGWDKQQNATIWQKEKYHVLVGGDGGGSSHNGKSYGYNISLLTYRQLLILKLSGEFDVGCYCVHPDKYCIVIP